MNQPCFIDVIHRLSRSIAVLTIALASSGALATQLLLNPGFETGNFSGWTVGGNSLRSSVEPDGIQFLDAEAPFPPNFANVRSGSFAGTALVRDGEEPAERLILTQTVAVVPNSIYTVGFWLGNDSASAFQSLLDDDHTQIFMNGVGLLLPVPFGITVPRGSSSADFLEFQSTFNSGNNNSIAVAFAINGSGSARVNASFDDFFVDGPAVVAAAPEAPTFILLGLGLVGVGVARRFGGGRQTLTA